MQGNEIEIKIFISQLQPSKMRITEFGMKLHAPPTERSGGGIVRVVIRRLLCSLQSVYLVGSGILDLTSKDHASSLYADEHNICVMGS